MKPKTKIWLEFIHAIKHFLRQVIFDIRKKKSLRTSATSWHTYSVNNSFVQTTITSTNQWTPKKYITMEPPRQIIISPYFNQHFILFFFENMDYFGDLEERKTAVKPIIVLSKIQIILSLKKICSHSTSLLKDLFHKLLSLE